MDYLCWTSTTFGSPQRAVVVDMYCHYVRPQGQLRDGAVDDNPGTISAFSMAETYPTQTRLLSLVTNNNFKADFNHATQPELQ
jgi:hypothetical protein